MSFRSRRPTANALVGSVAPMGFRGRICRDCHLFDGGLAASCLVVTISIIVYASFEFTSVFPVSQRGFFCVDSSIRYPRSRHETFPALSVLAGFVLVPDLIFLVVELCVVKNAFACLTTMLYFQCACAMSGIMTNIIKCVFGRLRPYFIDVCRPDVLVNMTCDSVNANTFITDYKCLGNGESTADDWLDARKSFPSGHSTTAVCGAVFISIYIWRRVPSKAPYVGRHLLVYFLLLLAVYVGITRISEFEHHLEDVLFGSLIGAFFGSYCGMNWWRAIDAISDSSSAPPDGTNSNSQPPVRYALNMAQREVTNHVK